MKSRVFPLALCGLLLVTVPACGGSDAAETAHWSYEGDTDSSHWGDLNTEWQLAKTGKKQSPIDLSNAESADVPDLVVDFKPTPLVVVNNGHTIQVDCASGSSVTVGGERYDLLQFHFHGPSEHTVNGKHASLEMHYVCKDTKGRLAVTSVLIEEGAENTELAKIWKEMPQTEGSAKPVAGVQVDPAVFLPKSRDSFRYSGSLTTPPCSENVRWIVMKEPIQVSKAQVAAFHKVFTRNNRPVQPLNDRAVRVGN